MSYQSQLYFGCIMVKPICARMQGKYNENTRKIQLEYNKNTMRIQAEYDENTRRIRSSFNILFLALILRCHCKSCFFLEVYFGQMSNCFAITISTTFELSHKNDMLFTNIYKNVQDFKSKTSLILKIVSQKNCLKFHSTF